MPKLSTYSIGKLGVNVDTDPVHSDDGQLSKAQNAIRDPLGGDGALRNRPGLVALNGSGSGGSISGGIGVPLTKVSTRSMLLASSNGSGFADGWLRSTTAYATNASLVTSNPAKCRGDSKLTIRTGIGYGFVGRPACVYKNRLYYAADGYTVSTDAPPIRVWDGTVDRELTKIPASITYAPTPSLAIVSMIAANGTLYVSVIDGATGIIGRVFQVDPDTGTITPLGGEFLNPVPYALEYANGVLWCGSFNFVGLGGATYLPTLSFIRPGIDTAWTLAQTFLSYQNVCALKSYNGLLYIALTGSLGNAALLKTRSALGVLATAQTASTSGGATFTNGYLALEVFNGNLYAVEYDPATTLRIRKFNGTTWSTAFTGVGGSTLAAYSQLLVDNGILFAATSGPGGGVLTDPNALLSTPDGTTWTDQTSHTLSENFAGGFGVVTS